MAKMTGTFYNPQTREIVSVRQDAAAPGDGWIIVSDDPSLGLLAARSLLLERGLVDAPATVDWYGLRGGSPIEEGAISALICRFKEADDGRKGGGGPRDGVLERLSDRLRDIVRGPGGDTCERSSLAAVPVPVRSDEATAPRRPR